MHSILFVCGISPLPDYQEDRNFSKVPFQYAAERFQMSFIAGFDQHVGASIRVVTAPFFGSWPFNHRKLFIKNRSFSKPCQSVGISYINLPIIKIFSKFINLISKIKEDNEKIDADVILGYSVNVSYLAAVVFANNFSKNVKRGVIITDLPEYPADCSFLYRSYLLLIEKPIINYLISKLDFYIVLTNQINDYFKISSNKSILIEGIFDYFGDLNDSSFVEKIKDKKIILYTGTVDERYGIRRLVDEFSSMADPNFELHICGGGPTVDYVKTMTIKNINIKYLGMKSQSEIAFLQKSADLLINPRDNVGDYNKYSFPSKLMEYMASGTPVLIYKLDGIPVEYYNYCYTFQSDESVAHAISRVFSDDESVRKSLALSAQNFILKRKSSKVQIGRFLDFLDHLKVIQ